MQAAIYFPPVEGAALQTVRPARLSGRYCRHALDYQLPLCPHHLATAIMRTLLAENDHLPALIVVSLRPLALVDHTRVPQSLLLGILTLPWLLMVT